MADSLKKLTVPKDVTDVLRTVLYPGSNDNIVTLDMVREIRIAGRRINFSLAFKQHDDPNVDTLVASCEDAIRKHFGEQTEVRPSVKFVERNAEREPSALARIRNIIVIASGKGGVGKSTVAVNIAVALANTGAKVGLVDADVFGPSIPKMFGAEDERPTVDNIDGREVINPVEKYGVKFLSTGFFTERDNALIWRGPMASNVLKQLINGGNWGALDYLLVDLPPGTGDIHLTTVQSMHVTGAVIVTTPQDVALADVVRGISMFRSKAINVPVLGLVENMSWFTPAELPENRYYIFGKGGGKAIADKLGLKLLGQIPIVQSIRESGDKGVPVAVDSESLTGAAFTDLAENIVRQVHVN